MEDNKKKNDLIVLGGGPAGYVAAIRAAQLGGSVIIVEKDELGGTCLNRGCIPTKAYLKNGEIIDQIRKASGRGILIENPDFSVDMPAVVKMKNKIVKKLTSGVESLLKANKVTIMRGTGVLTGPGKVLLNNEKELTAESVLIAGGSRVIRIPIPGVELPGVLTSDEILDITEIPPRLTIVGGGVIGVEMAQIFRSFGTEVNIVEMEERILPFMEPEISQLIKDELVERGIGVYTGTGVDKIVEKNNALSVFLKGGDSLDCENVLLSIGRTSDLTSLGDMKFEMNGPYVKVNDYMETSIEGVYAAGDITGRKMLAHAAFKMGEIAADNALGGKEKADLRFVPSIVYSHPEIASVGMGEDQLNEAGIEFSSGLFPLSFNGRALASGEEKGFVKVLTGKKYGEVLGVHMVGSGASEMINEAAALMAMEVTSEEIMGIIHGHPTVSEAFMEAAADSLGRCLHLPPKK